jgi:hypothetical protein
MLDPDDVGRRLQKHFDEVSDEDFLRNLRRAVPESEWDEMMSRRVQPRRPTVLARLRLGLRKLVLSLRPKPVAARPK